mmetsp:Transcript_110348/g.329982  ORF Transcript_110348/g.329982 Transcript_110348/m.329982 type:complete len:215 (+) Transcript_110348:377-1021(+)
MWGCRRCSTKGPSREPGPSGKLGRQDHLASQGSPHCQLPRPLRARQGCRPPANPRWPRAPHAAHGAGCDAFGGARRRQPQRQSPCDDGGAGGAGRKPLPPREGPDWPVVWQLPRRPVQRRPSARPPIAPGCKPDRRNACTPRAGCLRWGARRQGRWPATARGPLGCPRLSAHRAPGLLPSAMRFAQHPCSGEKSSGEPTCNYCKQKSCSAGRWP